ncbi:hypothetical protein [Ralstonia pickettii]|uniref:hypothetical protein n=1 Tax=Ralstonia pickettii TaxID=329 RepID=UPI0015BB6A72|nr:hypothetical protein [Ralstonia pickettii]NWK44741.1 hypothetical protein [Ralstonia pickettii]
MAWVRNFGGYVDFISYVLLSAPDDFPEEDYLSPDEQMNLEKAFEELRNGMHFVEEKIVDGATRVRLRDLLDASLSAYRTGKDVEGAHLLQDFEKLLLTKNP